MWTVRRGKGKRENRQPPILGEVIEGEVEGEVTQVKEVK